MRVKDGSAGQKSGVSKGDSLIAIDAQQTDGMTCWDIREELSKSGEAVRLDLLRNGKALTVELALEHPFDYPRNGSLVPQMQTTSLSRCRRMKRRSRHCIGFKRSLSLIQPKNSL